jgi:hypothetical protein
VVVFRGAKDLLSLRIWLKADSFVDRVTYQKKSFVYRVRQLWSSYRFQGSASFFAQKFKALKADLKSWNEQVFDNVEAHKKALLEELCALDSLEEERVLVAEEKLRKS